MMSFMIVQTKKLISMDDPFFSMTKVFAETQIVDLWQLGFMFALEDIDPRYGRIRAFQKTRFGKDGSSTEEEIKMVSCDNPEYVPNNPAFSVDILNGYGREIRFMCPDDLENLILEGQFGTDRFSYVSIEL